MTEPVGFTLEGGGVEANGQDVTVNAPVFNLGKQALLTNKKGQAVLLGKERDPDESLRCGKCRFSKDIVAIVCFIKEDGLAIRLCRDCVNRAPGDPLIVTLERG